MDYYQTLGVSRDASEAEIKKAYRSLVKETHPDSGKSDDIARFHAIQKAYEVLSDPKQRAAYDRPSPMSWTGGFEEPVAPFREMRPRVPRASVHLDIVMSPEEARRGARVVLEAPVERTCPRCGGRGQDFFGWCGGCGGEGRIEVREGIGFRVPPGAQHGDVVQARTRDGRTVRARIRLR